MATGEGTEPRGRRALGRARGEVQRRGTELARRARAAARDVRERVDRGRARAGPEGWRPARIAAAAAGLFLVWRALFGRGLARIPAGVAGLVVLSAVFPGAAARAGRGASPAAQARRVEVLEVKSPAEIEQGEGSGSPEPTFPSRVDRGPRAEPPPTKRRD